MTNTSNAGVIKGVHTVTNQAGTGWVNQTSSGTFLSRHRTKAVAVAAGKLLARRHATQYTEHSVDGTVIDTRSYAVKPLEQ
jgi:hypothetical protein